LPKSSHIDAGQYRAIHDRADNHHQAIFALWSSRGEPSGAIRELARQNGVEPRALRAFKLLPQQGVTVGAFRWVDQGQAGVGGSDWTSVIEHLANVDRPKAAIWLRDFIERHIANGRPSSKEPEAWRPIQAPPARNSAI
jgi:hypothetical protein